MTKKRVIRSIQFESSSRMGQFYTTLVYDDGSMSCNCKGWTLRVKNGVRECKHTKQVASGKATAGNVTLEVTYGGKEPVATNSKKQSPPTTFVLSRPRRVFNFNEED